MITLNIVGWERGTLRERAYETLAAWRGLRHEADADPPSRAPASA